MGLRERLVPLLKFHEQPHVLDGDDSLIGEGLQQRDLRARERNCVPATQQDHTYRRSFSQEWSAERRPLTRLSGQSASLGILVRFNLEIGHGNSLPFEHRAPRDGSPNERYEEAGGLRDRAVVGLGTQVSPVESKDRRIRGRAEARCTLYHLVQHRLEIRRRRADDPQDLRHGALLFKGFGQGML